MEPNEGELLDRLQEQLNQESELSDECLESSVLAKAWYCGAPPRCTVFQRTYACAYAYLGAKSSCVPHAYGHMGK